MKREIAEDLTGSGMIRVEKPVEKDQALHRLAPRHRPTAGVSVHRSSAFTRLDSNLYDIPFPWRPRWPDRTERRQPYQGSYYRIASVALWLHKPIIVKHPRSMGSLVRRIGVRFSDCGSQHHETLLRIAQRIPVVCVEVKTLICAVITRKYFEHSCPFTIRVDEIRACKMRHSYAASQTRISCRRDFLTPATDF